MSTRSCVFMKDNEGYCIGTYIQFDGYPSHVGKIINACLRDKESIRNFIMLGDIASINQKGMTIEANPYNDHICNVIMKKGEDGMIAWFTKSWCEYLYFWNGSEWQFIKDKQDFSDMQSLSQYLEQEKEG